VVNVVVFFFFASFERFLQCCFLFCFFRLSHFQIENRIRNNQPTTMGEVTEQEMIDIANNFLLSSPPGEFMEVVTGKSMVMISERTGAIGGDGTIST
jgi:hypothetical protein